MVSRFMRPSHPIVTPERIVAALVVVLVGFFLIGLAPFGTAFAYLILVVLTIVVVRSVPVEPGAWLGLRVVRRGLALLISLITLNFATISLRDYAAAAPALLIVLALSDYALGRATRRIASAHDDLLDERQEALRNRAHRIAYVILAVSVGLVVTIAEFATPATRHWLGESIGGGGALVSFLQLLFFLPAMVVAWLEPDRISGEDAPRLQRSNRARLARAMVAACVLVPLALSLELPLAPIRTSAFTQAQSFPESPTGVVSGRCLYFEAHKQAGIGFGATIPISAVACWNGTKAYESWGLNDSDCHPQRMEFVVDSTVTCRRSTDADGTLRFTYHTVLRSAFLGFISRNVVMTLALSKDGKVVQFP